GESEAGPTAALFASTYPERTDALIIYGSLSSGHADEAELATYGGRPGQTGALLAKLRETNEEWGEGRGGDFLLPNIVSPVVRRSYGMVERSAASPAMARALIESTMVQSDVRPALSAISVPTLVMHRRDDLVPIAHGRLIADRIPGARLVELDGPDHAIWTTDSDVIVGEIEQLITGSRSAIDRDRILATVLFTDIVQSTRRAAELGDATWRQLLDRHDDLVHREVEQAGGRVVKFVGDGMLAVFAGPARAIACAEALVAGLDELGLSLRAGVHTGESETRGEDLGGIAVHIGARVSAAAGPGEILVTRTVVDLVVGSGLAFADRGEHELGGVPGTWQLYRVTGRSAAA